MKIWANSVVNNEEKFIWFSVMSIIDSVDKVIIFDTGSTDGTAEIVKKIKEVKPNKIIFKQLDEVSAEDFPKIRQRMLDESECDWILVLDGDEIWWERSIISLISQINKVRKKVDGIVVPMIVPVGDIYHFQEEEAGKYKLLGRVGHLSLRAINKRIPGLHVDWPYGKESYLDENSLPVQDRKNIIFLNKPYLHVTHLERSSKIRKFTKYKHEIGKPFPKDFKYPEVFYKTYPGIVPSPWSKILGFKLLKSKVLTPFRKIKRRLI